MTATSSRLKAHRSVAAHGRMPTRKTSAAESNQVQKAYQQFEFTSLRQLVSTAEKPRCIPLKVGGNAGNSAYFTLKPDSEKVSCLS
jgi:hypothetical protein